MGGLGWDYDDKAAFQAARLAMVPVGQVEIRALLTDREEIMRTYGAYLFAEIPDERERRKRMKGIINGFDMGSGLEAWAKQWGNPHDRRLRDHSITLQSGQRYDICQYWRAQGTTQAWVEAQAARMTQFVRNGMTKHEVAKHKRPVMRVLSYLLQEAEAVSRNAKIEWCDANGIQVLNL